MQNQLAFGVAFEFFPQFALAHERINQCQVSLDSLAADDAGGLEQHNQIIRLWINGKTCPGTKDDRLLVLHPGGNMRQMLIDRHRVHDRMPV